MSKRSDLLIATAMTAAVLGGGIVLAQPEPQPSGWGGAGAVQTVSISLGGGMALSGNDKTVEESAQSDVDSRKGEEDVKEVQKDPEVTPPLPEPKVEQEPEPEPKPVPEVKTKPEPEPKPEPVPEKKVVAKPVPPKPKLELAEITPPPVKPRPPKKPVHKVTKPKPEPQPVPTPEVAETPRQPQQDVAEKNVRSAGSTINSRKVDGTSGTSTKSQAASSASGSGGGASMSSAKFVDYQTSVVQTLMRYREYPPLAQRRGIEGRNMVRLVIERDGTVSSIEMIEQSGHGLLDRATEDMIDRVKRFPPFPDDLKMPRMVLRVPVVYDLR